MKLLNTIDDLINFYSDQVHNEKLHQMNIINYVRMVMKHGVVLIVENGL